MMTGVIVRAWKNLKPHVPLIKFRKGGVSRDSVVSEESAAKTHESNKAGTPYTANVLRPVIEDWQLPPRYRRAVLDDKEIESINSGGAY